jgi:hypothetical protein
MSRRVRALIDSRASRTPLEDMAKSASSLTQAEKVADQVDSAYETVLLRARIK